LLLEWKGAFNENDTVWNDATKSCIKRVNLEKKEDGIFMMTYEDMLLNFDAIHICYSKDLFVYAGLKYSNQII
jgi:hypothetical protein